MTTSASNIVLVVTATTTALIAGLFYAWSCSVIPGIVRLPDAAYLDAMQVMNRAILNPLFFLSFMGTVILLPVSTYMHYAQPVTTRFWFLLAATLLYCFGTFGVTVVGNVPLNENLDAFNIKSASSEAITAQRTAFEKPWIKLHSIRTLASILALVMTLLACMSPAANPITK
jgi:uncharacterized membrane protein